MALFRASVNTWHYLCFSCKMRFVSTENNYETVKDEKGVEWHHLPNQYCLDCKKKQLPGPDSKPNFPKDPGIDLGPPGGLFL